MTVYQFYCLFADFYLSYYFLGENFITESLNALPRSSYPLNISNEDVPGENNTTPEFPTNLRASSTASSMSLQR